MLELMNENYEGEKLIDKNQFSLFTLNHLSSEGQSIVCVRYANIVTVYYYYCNMIENKWTQMTVVIIQLMHFNALSGVIFAFHAYTVARITHYKLIDVNSVMNSL